MSLFWSTVTWASRACRIEFSRSSYEDTCSTVRVRWSCTSRKYRRISLGTSLFCDAVIVASGRCNGTTARRNSTISRFIW